MKLKNISKLLVPIVGLAFSATAYAAQPAYSSRPSSSNVFYLDFDGEFVTASQWPAGQVNASTSGLSNAEILSHWEHVAEVFVGFDVNVTTDRAVYDAAQVTTRQMCVITPTDTAAPGNGGVAVLNSFGTDQVCWSFVGVSSASPNTTAHEFGHTLALNHDGYGDHTSSAYEEYYEGNGSWSPIMGGGSSSLEQWSKGEYFQATNLQDDLYVIAGKLGYIADEAPDTLPEALPGQVSSIPVSGSPDTGLSATSSGVLAFENDADIYRFDIAAGTYDIDISVTPTKSVSLDVKAALYDARWQRIDVVNPAGIESASLLASANTETLYLVVSGGSEGTPLLDGSGWTSYASLGSYDVTFSAIRTALTTPLSASFGYAPVVEDASFSVTSTAAVGTVVSQVTASDVDAGSSLTYSIISGNEGGGFAINSSTGEITVLNELNFITETIFTMTVLVTDNMGLSNTSEVTGLLIGQVAHDEAVDGNFADTSATATVISLSVGPNVIIGELETGADEDWFTFNVPVGYKISKIVANSHRNDGLDPANMRHYKDGSIAGSYQLFFMVNFTDITDEFSSLGAGDHVFQLEPVYGISHEYEIAISIAPVFEAGWSSQDIGSVSIAGSGTVNESGEYVLEGSGPAIWASDDEFQYVHRALDGDGQITAQVQSISSTYKTAKAGVMIRETLDDDSKYVSTFVTPTKGSRSQARLTTGAITQNIQGTPTAVAPHWVRLERAGDVFTSSESVDGVSWTVVETWTVPMASQVYIGLANTSSQSAVLSTAVFSDVDVLVVPPNNAPTAFDASITVPGSSAIGTTIGSVVGTDPDAGDTLSYAITAGNTGGAFAMNASNGEITVASALDYYTQSVYNLSVTVTDSGSLSDTATVTITLTDPTAVIWYSQDIGAVSAAGSAVINGNGEDVITASGADIYGTADEFHYSYQSVTGDCEITAQVKSLTNTNVWAKAGVMIRETLDADSINAATFITPGKGISSQTRVTTAGETTFIKGSTTAAAPYWVRLSRVGDVFTSSGSADGVTWTVVETWTVPMASQVYVGLAVTSHNDGVLTTAVIDNVSVVEGDLGITYNAADFDEESHPNNDNTIAIQGTNVAKIKNGNWIKFADFDFGSGASNIEVSAASDKATGGSIEFRTGSPTGTLIGTVVVADTNGWNTFVSFSDDQVVSVSDIDDLYLVFTGDSGVLMKLGSLRVD